MEERGTGGLCFVPKEKRSKARNFEEVANSIFFFLGRFNDENFFYR